MFTWELFRLQREKNWLDILQCGSKCCIMLIFGDFPVTLKTPRAPCQLLLPSGSSPLGWGFFVYLQRNFQGFCCFFCCCFFRSGCVVVFFCLYLTCGSAHFLKVCVEESSHAPHSRLLEAILCCFWLFHEHLMSSLQMLCMLTMQ